MSCRLPFCAAVLLVCISVPAVAKTIPALTPVSVEVLAPVGSKISKTGDTFPIRLAVPIVIDGKEAVPAGATGMGEVVHAKKGGGSGAPGELVLAARYIELDGSRIRLRSMHLSPVGKDNLRVAQVTSVAVGVFGLLVQGGNSEVPAGTIAEAKTAEAFELAEPSIKMPVSGALPDKF